jgi:hypothetical protein
MLRTILYFALTAVLLSSCDEGPYLKHELKQEKLGGDCNSISRQFSLTANTIGDRFVYEACLDAAYAGNYSVERKGDTVVVQTQKSGGSTTPYRITLDINTYPEYHYLSLDGVVNQVHTSR